MVEFIVAVAVAVGFIGIADVLIFHGKIGVAVADKIKNLFHAFANKIKSLFHRV